jgi:hypothetical protein
MRGEGNLPKAPPRSLNSVVDLFHTGGDGLLARAKFGRPLDSSVRGIDDPPPPARLDLFNVVINRPMLHGLERINVVTVFKNGNRLIPETQLPCFGSGTG